jgi:thiamine biosynthesis protein ThiC
MADACYRQVPFVDLKEGEFIEAARQDIERGIEVMLLPLGVTRSIVAGLKNSNRVMPCCSKSGSIMSAWIAHTNQENPYCRHFDDLLALARSTARRCPSSALSARAAFTTRWMRCNTPS